MATRYFGAPIKRNEDRACSPARRCSSTTSNCPGMLHAAFLRSQDAHARIAAYRRVAGAARATGVVAVYTADDLGDYWQPGPLLVPPPPIAGIIFNQRTQVPLAKDKVRHVGEPIAVVIAESRYLAEDALADIVVELEPLPAVVDLEQALARRFGAACTTMSAATSPRMSARAKGDYAARAAHADHVIRRRFRYDRGAAAPIENRGVVADWDGRADQLTVWDTTQAPIPFATASPACSA